MYHAKKDQKNGLSVRGLKPIFRAINHDQMLTVEGALHFIPSHDRDIWLKVLMALKSEFDNNAYSIAEAWSQTADNYKSKDFINVWQSLSGNGITISTVFYLAKENGWKYKNSSGIARPLPKIKSAPFKKLNNTNSYALKLWQGAITDDRLTRSHPYAISKGIQSNGGASRGIASSRKIIGTNADCIIVPIRNIQTDKVQGVQCINCDGRKQTFGRVSGGGLLLGNILDKTIPWYVCEGWSSAYSMVFHHQDGNGVCVCSFGKSNQQKVANLIAEFYKPNEIIILLEDDS
ncbi:MAG: PriCT-2 domain-containing protein [Enterobacterales bacterium]|nr:PriCT-2 domain-containing protein [Enterobacterales bacterium]